MVNMRRAIADSHAFLDDFDRSVEEYKKLIDDYPENVWTHIGYGDIFMDRDQFEQAIEIYENGRKMISNKSDIVDIEERIEMVKTMMK